MGYPILGGLQAIVAAGQTGHYASFPWAQRTAAGNRLVAYRDWDGSNAADHSTGGAAWLIRNEGSPAMKWDTTTFGGGREVQDTFVYANPANSAQLIYMVRTDLAGATAHYYSLSTNEGVTWSAPASLPAVSVPSGTGWTSAAQYAFFDFLPSSTGSALYATVYGSRSGYASDSVALAETSDGVTWSVRSWITLGSIAPGNETGLIRMANGRIIAAIRHSTNATAGWTCYSDDDGLTWSAAVQQTYGFWNAPRGFALSTREFCLICRENNVSRWNGYGHAFYVLTSSGTLIGKSVHLWKLYLPSHGGYFSRPIVEGDGYSYIYGYFDIGGASGTVYPGLYKSRVTYQP